MSSAHCRNNFIKCKEGDWDVTQKQVGVKGLLLGGRFITAVASAIFILFPSDYGKWLNRQWLEEPTVQVGIAR